MLTLVWAVMVKVQVAMPGQPPPLRPAKVEPLAGLAVRVTAAAVIGGRAGRSAAEPRGLNVMVPPSDRGTQ